jgi:hypothetical protein
MAMPRLAAHRGVRVQRLQVRFEAEIGDRDGK